MVRITYIKRENDTYVAYCKSVVFELKDGNSYLYESPYERLGDFVENTGEKVKTSDVPEDFKTIAIKAFGDETLEIQKTNKIKVNKVKKPFNKTRKVLFKLYNRAGKLIHKEEKEIKESWQDYIKRVETEYVGEFSKVNKDKIQVVTTDGAKLIFSKVEEVKENKEAC